MTIHITARPLGHGRVAVSTLEVLAPGKERPLEHAFTGPWHSALFERNRRCEEWAEVADEIIGDKMPVMF